MSKLKQAFYSQRHTAARRGLLFILTFEEWLKIWTDSGKLEERGRKKGQYCMARNNDAGPYVQGNVKIVLQSENTKESWSLQGDAIAAKMAIAHSGLTKQQVAEVRKLSVGHGPYKIGQLLGIHPGVARKILQGKTYRDV